MPARASGFYGSKVIIFCPARGGYNPIFCPPRGGYNPPDFAK
jgi:hypothetical protein